jgi:hypothetical protein
MRYFFSYLAAKGRAVKFTSDRILKKAERSISNATARPPFLDIAISSSFGGIARGRMTRLRNAVNP